MIDKIDKDVLPEEVKTGILNRYRGLLRACRKCVTRADTVKIRKAFNSALVAHLQKKRDSGDPYIYHPIAVARIAVEEIGLGSTSVISALLHETVREGVNSLQDIEKDFGKPVRNIVEGLTKLSEISGMKTSLQAENFRKLLLTMSTDVRVILLKLADRLENMRNLEYSSAERQLKTASETFYLYAPLAHRLGLYNIKSEMEDLSMKYTNPDIYLDIDRKLRNTTTARNRFIREFTEPIKQELASQGFSFEIKGRTKSVYSIWNKMKRQQAEFSEVYDIFAIRIIIDTELKKEKADCWRVYSVVTDFYQPNTNRMRDWISVPKSNGYESLHTTVVGPGGKFVEVQIRTRRMDEIAEKGLAAHWKYKGEGIDRGLGEWLTHIREVLENPEPSALEFVDNFKLNLYSEEVFVFTPNGDLKRFPAGATVLDFAFEIHSDVGSTCVGAKVNGKNVPIKQVLQNGDQISILTSKNQRPKIDWLNWVVTAKARTKIKNSIKEERQVESDAGKELLSRRLKNWKIGFPDRIKTRVLKHYKVKTSFDFFYLIGSGRIDPADVKELIIRLEQKEREQAAGHPDESAEQELPADGVQVERQADILIIDESLNNVDYKLARCCNPVFGDQVFGFVSVSDGIKIHRISCPNAPSMLSRYDYRVVKARWTSSPDTSSFQVMIRLSGIDEVGIVNRISDVVSKDLKMTLRSISIDSNDGMFDGVIRVIVKNKYQLDLLLHKLSGIKAVNRASRLDR
ncbi:MAG: bifunctional (p)ppGpp synthetase/guanosine-3',5'-bis(diphosphate) 3'-pyrophosphohydrolase [Marinilabiliales bacterium]|nr:MAG: bifunctional (p)ppGpp synthetase/guanosine-3',5'-bis(diphosphate) 3'-pyrophosphohydrolase [Marinilabiliales bacterium]